LKKKDKKAKFLDAGSLAFVSLLNTGSTINTHQHARMLMHFYKMHFTSKSFFSPEGVSLIAFGWRPRNGDLGRRRFGAHSPAFTGGIRAKHTGGYPRML
jgi:hypothetical protein